MAFIDELRALSSSLAGRLDHLDTEEATKHALVLPFIGLLGYDTHSPTEVRPEFIADVGMKKDEKVDYALLQDRKPVILIECKAYGTSLSKRLLSQLQRYFLTTDARFGVLTDGIVYQLYSDLDADNKMDEDPFLEFNALDFVEAQVELLEQFTKTRFSVDKAVSAARESKYTTAIKRLIAQELENPSDEFVRYIVGRVYDGRSTQAIREQFRTYMLSAFAQITHEQASPSPEVSNRFSSQPSNSPPQMEPEVPSEEPPVSQLSGWQSLATLKPVAVNGGFSEALGHSVSRQFPSSHQAMESCCGRNHGLAHAEQSSPRRFSTYSTKHPFSRCQGSHASNRQAFQESPTGRASIC